MDRKANQNYIKAIADVGSISLAAENLGISQPALSSYLKKHEKELGHVLFDRSRQPIELTEEGRVYLDYLDKAAALEKEMTQNLSDIGGLKTGHLTIGGASFFNIAYIPKAVAAFAKEYPGVDIEIVDGKVPELTTMAQKGVLDLFITPTADDDRFVFEELIEEKIFMAVPSEWEINRELEKKHAWPEDSGQVITKDEFRKLCRYPFIVLKKDQDIGSKMEELFSKFSCRPAHVIMAEQTMTSLALTEAGIGASLITESSMKNISLRNMPGLYMADNAVCRRKMFIAYPKNKYLSKAAGRFKDILKEVNRQ